MPPFIGEGGQQPMRGAAAPTPFSPLHGGGNPPHQMSNPLSYFPFNLHDIHTN